MHMKRAAYDLQHYIATNARDTKKMELAVDPMKKTLRELIATNYIHNDLKPANVLVQTNEDGAIEKLNLADFGLSSTYIEGSDAKLKGTPMYYSLHEFAHLLN